MTELAHIFIAGFASVFLLGFQSRNVNHGNYAWAGATSFLVAIAQASIWSKLASARAGTVEVCVYGASGSLGILCAMWLHQRYVRRKK